MSPSVLCFGDSNTWGRDPRTGDRFEEHQRWPGVLQSALGGRWRVIAEGLPGRTTIIEDPLGDRQGIRHLSALLVGGAPLDLVIVALGTNDLKTRFDASPSDIAEGAGLLLDCVRSSGAGSAGGPPDVLLVSPAPLSPRMPSGGHEKGPPEMGMESIRKSRALAAHFARVAGARGVPVLDAGSYVRTSPIDGVHWEASEHRAFGHAMAAEVRSKFAHLHEGPSTA